MLRSFSVVLSIGREGLFLKITVKKGIIHEECVYAVQVEWEEERCEKM